MDPLRWLIDFVFRLLIWIIGVWTRIWLGLRIIFGCAVVTMDHQRYLHQLKYYLDRDDGPWILTMIDHIFVYEIPELNYLTVATVIKHGCRSAFYSLYLLRFGKFIPRDEFRQQRVEILAFIPDYFKYSSPALHFIASYVSCIILERDHGRYKNYKAQFGEFLIGYPKTASNSVFDIFISDRHRMDIMRYVEKYVKPDWSDESVRTIDNALCILAKRLQADNKEDFMETIMESDCYTYHGMMTALTTSVDRGILTSEPCVGFMVSKVDKVDPSGVGTVDDNLKLLIEEQFVLALLKPLNVFGIDRFLQHLARNNVIQPLALERAVKKHVLKVFSVLLDKPEHNSLIYFTRLCALSKFCPSEKNAILKMLVEFGTEYVDLMSCFQANVLCATLSTLSYPKRECQVNGSDKIFHFLFKRLMDMMPELGTTKAEIDILAHQNVLIALYNLYSIGERENEVMKTIDRRWKDKIVHASDLHIVTSRNVQAEIERVSDIGWKHSTIMDGLLRLQSIIVSNGQVFHYLLGNVRKNDLVLDLPHASEKQCFEDSIFTNSWLCSMVNFTRTPKGDKPPLPIPDVRRFSADEESSEEDDDDEEEENEDEEIENVSDEDEEVKADSNAGSNDENLRDDDKDDEVSEDKNEANNVQPDNKNEGSDTVENLSDSGLGDCCVDKAGSVDLAKSSDNGKNNDDKMKKEADELSTFHFDYAVFAGASRHRDEEDVGTEYSVGSDDEDIDLLENSWFRMRDDTDYDLWDALNDERDRRWTRALSHNDGIRPLLHLSEGILVHEVHFILEGFFRSILNIPQTENQNNQNEAPPPANNAPPRAKDPERILIIQD